MYYLVCYVIQFKNDVSVKHKHHFYKGNFHFNEIHFKKEIQISNDAEFALTNLIKIDAAVYFENVLD